MNKLRDIKLYVERKNSKLKDYHRIFILILIIAILFTIPYPTYKIALLAGFVRLIFIMLFFVLGIKYIIKELLPKYNTKLEKFNVYKNLHKHIAGITGLLMFLMLLFPTLIPSYEEHDIQKGVQEGVIYLTYNHDCEYCKKSYDAIKRSAFVYNSSHPFTKVQIVNLKDDTRLARDLSNSLEHYGTISKATKKDLYEIGYSLADSEGNPISNTPDYIYEKILELKKINL